MVTRYGMTDEFDMVAMETVNNQYLGGDTSLMCSPETAKRIDEKVVQIVREQHEKAIHILKENETKLHEIAAYLLDKETITGEEFMEILKTERRWGKYLERGRIKERLQPRTGAIVRFCSIAFAPGLCYDEIPEHMY